MKRDMDLYRRIALTVADLPFGQRLNSLKGVAKEDFVMHVLWMREDGLVETVDSGVSMNTLLPIPAEVWINRLTAKGCDFVDAASNDTLWDKFRKAIITPSLAFTFDVFMDWAKAEITKSLPTLRG